MDNTFLHSKKLLLVDDEPELLKKITKILDVMLPDGDGFSLMEQMRTWTDIPIIVLTARDEATDKLAGLEPEADDDIAKPFLPQEFLLRVYAVLRRCYKKNAMVLKLNNCTVDFSRAEHPFRFVVFFSLGDLLLYTVIPVTIVCSKTQYTGKSTLPQM